MADRKPNKVEKTANLGRAVGHPLRVEILGAFRGASAEKSPNELASELRQPLGNVSHHIKFLIEVDALVLVGTEPRRGALEHFYRLTPTGTEVKSVIADL